MDTQVYPIKVSKLIFKNYCYLVVDTTTRDAVLVDPAWEMEKIEQLMQEADANLKAVLITHHHPDHINLANAFAKKYQIPAMMSQIEISYYNFDCTNLTPILSPDVFHVGELAIMPLFTPGHTLFIDGCGMCYDRGSDPGEMFDTLCNLQKILPVDTKIYPGHSYGKEPGAEFQYLLENNIYLQFRDKEQFIEFRMRKNQRGALAFK